MSVIVNGSACNMHGGTGTVTPIPIPNLPVSILSDFMGIAGCSYPNSGPSPIGILPYKFVRLNQIPEANWNTIETSAGVYSASALAISIPYRLNAVKLPS